MVVFDEHKIAKMAVFYTNELAVGITCLAVAGPGIVQVQALQL